jgi:hypothetical protein
MSQRTLRPGLTAAMTAGRALLAAGWKVGSADQLADGSTQRNLLHPSGRARAITAITDPDGGNTELTMYGLDLVQVAGAITGAGLTTPDQPADERPATPKSLLAAALRRLADDIEQHNLPIPTFALHLSGCVESRSDVERWADHLGVKVEMGGTQYNIPVAEQRIPVAGDRYLTVAFQGPSEPHVDRVAELEAEVAALRAQVAGGAQ